MRASVCAESDCLRPIFRSVSELRLTPQARQSSVTVMLCAAHSVSMR